MKYCTTCLYPETKPDLWFDDEGKCSACLAFEARRGKNWAEWEDRFINLVKQNKKHSTYDCIVPVSGGKDSHYQVIKIRELGFNPLCVCARTDYLTPIGRRNLDNIAKLGVDLIEINVDNKLRKRVAKYALETVGDISWCEHVLIFTVPFNIACQYGIPTIIYGENPQNEYGAGPKGTESLIELGHDWLQEFGGLNGLRVDDIISSGLATKNQMFQYKMPDGYSLDVVEPKAYFMGQFIPWNGRDNALLAQKNGFECLGKFVEGSICDYENLDNYQTGLHDYFKFIKYGFGRSTDIANNFLRRDEITREHAKVLIYQNETRYHPITYLEKSLRDILQDIDMPFSTFIATMKKFTNYELFLPGKLWPTPKFMQDLKNA